MGINTPLKLIALALGTILSSSAHAALTAVERGEVEVNWNKEMEAYFREWVERKEQARGRYLIQGLINSHFKVAGDDLALRVMPQSTQQGQQNKNIDLIQNALKYYNLGSYGVSSYALNNLKDPVSLHEQLTAQFILGLIHLELGEVNSAIDNFRTIPIDSELGLLANLNLATIYSKNERIWDASKTLESLLKFIKNKNLKQPYIKDIARLNLARIYGINGDRDSANDIFNDLQLNNLGEILFYTNAEINSHQGNHETALEQWLMASRRYPKESISLNMVDSSVLMILKKLGAYQQHIDYGETFLNRAFQHHQKMVSGDARPDIEFIYQQLLEQDVDSVLPHIDIPVSRNLAKELQLVRELVTQVQKNHQLLDEYKRYFSVNEQFEKEINHQKDQLFYMPSDDYEEELEVNPELRQVEELLTTLVGNPQPSAIRYEMLDGMYRWKFNIPFPHRWWEGGHLDLFLIFEAKQVLEKMLTERVRALGTPKAIDSMVLLNHYNELEIRSTEIQLIGPPLQKRLEEHLLFTLKSEMANDLRPLEQQLLWVATEILPNTRLIDNPPQQHHYSLTKKGQSQAGGGELQKTLLEASPPKIDSAFKVLSYLADSAREPLVRAQAMLHLADLHLTSAERTMILGYPDPTGIPGKLSSAIHYFQKLTVNNIQQIDHAAVLYQLARALDLNGQLKESLTVLDQLAVAYPDYPIISEVHFRRGELNFSFAEFEKAAKAYQNLSEGSPESFFIDKANYKLGWSYFKLGEYQLALNHFINLVDLYWDKRTTGSEREKRMLGDTFRVISMTFANMNGVSSAEEIFASRTNTPYREQIYYDLAQYYERKLRYIDAAETFSLLDQSFPYSEQLPYYVSRIVLAYKEGNFPSKLWPAREYFVEKFGIKSPYWSALNEQQREEIRGYLKVYLKLLGQRDHAIAQENGNRDDYLKAISWYEHYVKALPSAEESVDIYFLQGEAYSEIKEYAKASDSYLLGAYLYPQHPLASESAYAALVNYQTRYNLSNNPQEKQRLLTSAINEGLHFIDTFPNAKETPWVQTKLAEDRLIEGNASMAFDVASGLVERKVQLPKDLNQRLWLVYSHAGFASAHYQEAEQGYKEFLSLITSKDKLHQDIVARYAESIYKQGESAQKSGELEDAIEHYLRLGVLLPNAKIRANAEFDAATLLIKLKRWPEALTKLELFRTSFPKHTLQGQITEKLVLGYEFTEQWDLAAKYLHEIYLKEGDTPLGRDALWRTAGLYTKAKSYPKADKSYRQYIKTFPLPLDAVAESRVELAKLAKIEKREKLWHKETLSIIDTHKTGGSHQTERTHFLASAANLDLGKEYKQQFENLQLTLPIEKSLPPKQVAMEQAIKHLGETIKMGIADHSTESTNHIGSIYASMAKDLVNSERPSDLTPLELEQYEILLEDQIFPFEERSIELHELNARQIGEDIYNSWIKDSLNKLRQLMPARYNKPMSVDLYVETPD